jgi:hypothetical protein
MFRSFPKTSPCRDCEEVETTLCRSSYRGRGAVGLCSVILAVVGGGASCGGTADTSAEDATPPTVKIDVHQLENGTGITDATDQCCQIRRAIQPAKVLPVLASGEDAESGVVSLEIAATVIQRCRGIDSLGITREGLFEIEVQIGAATAPAGTNTAPAQLAAGGNFRLADQSSNHCPPIQVEDETGIHNRDRQLLEFCGARVFARARNGKGTVASTKTILIVPGLPGSGAFPCPGIPF